MPHLIHYNEYRHKIASLFGRFVSREFKKILIFGDKFDSQEETWKNWGQKIGLPADLQTGKVSLEDTWKSWGKKVIRLETLKPDWLDLSRDKTDFDLPVEKQYFDLIIGYHGLEKALDPERLLLELRKYLVKDGTFINISYNIGHTSTLVNIITEGWALKQDGPLKEGNIRYFSHDSLVELFQQTGFEITGKDIYAGTEYEELSDQTFRLTQNHYVNAISFIIKGKKIDTFPFIEGTYP